jgi:hypothetical protein
VDFIINIVKGLVAKEPTRLVAYASAAAIAGALKLGELLGVELTAEAVAGVGAIAALVVTEIIRRFVFSPETTQAIADRAAVYGDTDIGNPPKGE